MEVCKLTGVTKDYLWGGKRLFSYGKASDADIIAESWELSVHKNGPCVISSGTDKGKLLSETVTEEDLGKDCTKFGVFPLLIKLIDAKSNLSIQVHPSDEYAKANENSLGKTEMWYVVDAAPGAMLHIGFSRDVSAEEVRKRIADNTLEGVLNHIPVYKGDCFLIKSGTIHAIGAGCLVYEVQENSDITYRVYDYGRRDKNGNLRELHVEKALKVLNFNKSDIVNTKGRSPLQKTDYFTVEKLVNPTKITAKTTSFVSVTVMEGEGTVNDIPFYKGDTFFIPASQEAVVKGDCQMVKAEV